MVLKPMSEEEKQARTRDADLRSRFVEMRRAAEDDLRRRQEDLSKAHAEREAAMRRQAEEEARKKAADDARQKAEGEAARRLNGQEKTGKVVGRGRVCHVVSVQGGGVWITKKQTHRAH